MNEALNNKEFAKILYDLHFQIFNRLTFKFAYCDLDISGEECDFFRKMFQLSQEEIWAYGKKIIYLSDDINPNMIDVLRKRKVSRLIFIYKICKPIAQNSLHKKNVALSNVRDFVCKKRFLHGICKERDYSDWLSDSKPITVEEAEMILKNIKYYFGY